MRGITAASLHVSLAGAQRLSVAGGERAHRRSRHTATFRHLNLWRRWQATQQPFSQGPSRSWGARDVWLRDWRYRVCSGPGGFWWRYTETGEVDSVYKEALVRKGTPPPKEKNQRTTKGKTATKKHLISIREDLRRIVISVSLTYGWIVAEGEGGDAHVSYPGKCGRKDPRTHTRNYLLLNFVFAINSNPK